MGVSWPTNPQRIRCLGLPIYEIFIEGKPRKIELERTGENSFTAQIDGEHRDIELPAEKLDFENQFRIKIGDKTYPVELTKIDRKKPFPVKVEETTFQAEVKTPRRTVSPAPPPSRGAPSRKKITPKQVVKDAITAPMTGRILSVMTRKGEEVKEGQVLCTLEAMKMENEITTPRTGTVREVYVSEGSPVSEGEALFVVS